MYVLYDLSHLFTACITVRLVNENNFGVFQSWSLLAYLSCTARLANTSCHGKYKHGGRNKIKPNCKKRKLLLPFQITYKISKPIQNHSKISHYLHRVMIFCLVSTQSPSVKNNYCKP